MKQIFYKLGFLCSLGITVLSNAQTGRVGINIEKPKASLHISERKITRENSALAQGVIFPHITTAQRNVFQNVEKGTMIFNTSKQCLEIYAGTPAEWFCVHQYPQSSGGSSSGGGIGGGTPGGYNPEIAELIIQKVAYGGNYTSGVELNDSNIVTVKLYNPRSTPFTNLNLSNSLTFDNGIDNIRVKPGQNTRVTIPAKQSIELRYSLAGIPIDDTYISYKWNNNGGGVFSYQRVASNPSDENIRYTVNSTRTNQIGYGFATRDFNTHCNRLKALYPNTNIMIGKKSSGAYNSLQEIFHICQ